MPRESGLYKDFVPNSRPEIPRNIKDFSESDLIAFVTDRAARAFQAKSYTDMVGQFDRMERAYDGRFKNPNVPKWKSQMYVRTAFRLCEVEKAYMRDAIFDQYPYVNVYASESKYRGSAPYMENLINYHYRRMQYERKFWDNFNYVVKHGVAVTRRYWEFAINYRPKRLFHRGPNGMPLPSDEMVDEAYVEYDNPSFWVCDPRCVAWDPEGEYSNYTTMRYVCEEYVQDMDYLWANKDRYGLFGLKDLFREDASGGMIFSNPVQEEMVSRNLGSDPHRKPVAITEYSGRLDLHGNQTDPRWYSVLIANGHKIIGLRPIQGNPYDIYNVIGKERTMHGVSPISVLMTDVDIMNTLVNLRLDGIQYLMHPRYMSWRGALVDPEKDLSKIGPGQEIQIKHGYDMQKALQYVQQPDFGRIAYEQQLGYHERHMEQNIALTPNWSGANNENVISATEVHSTMERANSRFRALVNCWRTTGYSNFVDETSKAIMNNMTEDLEVPLFGDDWKPSRDVFLKVAPAMIQGEYLFYFKDNLQSNKEVETQHWNNLLTAMNNVWDKLGDTRVTTVVRELMRANPMGKQLDLDKMFPPSTPAENDLMNNENSRLEQAFAGPGMGPQPGGNNPLTEAAASPGRGTAQQVLNTMMKMGK